MIEHILKCLGREEPKGWKRRSFNQRKELFKETMADYTAEMFPSETAFFAQLVASATDLQWQRNTIAHGYIKGRSIPDQTAPTGHRATFYAVGEHNHKPVMIELDEPTLQRLRHEIGHLGGNLMAAVQRMGGHLTTESPEIVFADKEILQGPQSGSLTILPISKTPQPPPQSSGA